MGSRYGLLVLTLVTSFLASPTHAQRITAAEYATAVDRYGHFALGRPHEYAQLQVKTDAGQTVALDLSEDEVFEDVSPRLVTLAAGEPTEVLTIVSQRDKGSRLALIRLKNGRLEMSAESPPIGTPNRWLNPIGVVDLDGDKKNEFSAVTTPHIGGTLRIYRRQGRQLVEIASLPGFSNHQFGKSEQGLSAIVSVGGHVRMLVPDSTRNRLRLIAWDKGSLKEISQCPVAAPVTGPVQVISAGVVLVGIASGQERISVSDCLTN